MTMLLQIKVKPNAKSSFLAQLPDGTWVADVKAPPVGGKANKELVALVARHFRCQRSAVTIKAGQSGRMKFVKIEGV